MASAYRYGNDIRVYWTIIDSEGQPYNLEGRDLRLWMKNGTRKFEVTDYHVAGNIITWVYYGKNQSNCFLGTFEAILCENCGEIGMATLDTQDVFRLVSRSKDSSAGDGVRVRTEAVVNIQSQLTSSVQQLCITKEEYEDIFGVGSATHGGSAMETPDVLASLKDYIDKENIEDIYVLDTYPSVGTVYSEDVFDAMATSKAVAISGDDAILGRAVHFDGGSYLSFLKITSDDKSGVVVVATLSHGEDEYTVTALTETVVVDRVYLEQNFLSIADAAATYLSKAVAAATYLKITDAAVQYVAKTGGVFTGPVSFSGGISATGASLSGEVNMNNNRIRNVASPVNDADAANKGWVVALIGSIQQFHYEVYPSLSSVTDPQGNVLYLIGPTGSGTDKYEEYVYDSSKTNPWIKIGDTSIDLSGYMPKSGGRFSGRVIFEDGASFEGSLSLDDVQIHGLADPTNLGDAANKRYVDNGLASKQDTLVSGSNIKTVNGATLLGSGNIKVKEAPQVVDTSVNKYLTFDWGSGVLMSLVTLKYLNGYRNLLLNLYPSGENHASVIDLDGAVNCLQDDTFEYSEGLGAGYFHLISSVTSATISIISGESGVVITAEAEPTYVDASAEIVPYLGTAVKYTAQSLTEAQKTQARENIGAASASDVTSIESYIPAQASAQNQLADKNFVNSSIQTNTATFRGTYYDLKAFVEYSTSEYGIPDNNDYAVVRNVETSAWDADNVYQADEVCLYDDGVSSTKIFLCIKDMVSTPRSITPDQDTEYWKEWMNIEQLLVYHGPFVGTWRFKYVPNGAFDITNWQPEYQVNEKPLTAAQLAALNSGITDTKVAKLDALPATIPTEVFVAEYRVTPFADILAAYNANKEVICNYNRVAYRMSSYLISGGVPLYIYFTSLITSPGAACIAVKNDETWTMQTLYLERTLDKVSTISGNETNTTKYPNTKAVADALGKWGVISQTQTWTQAADGGYDYTMSGQVYGVIPQANIDLFVAAGAEFDTATGYFKLNGLTDISYEEMQKIYAISFPRIRQFYLSAAFASSTARTNFCIFDYTEKFGGTPFGGVATPSVDMAGIVRYADFERLSYTRSALMTANCQTQKLCSSVQLMCSDEVKLKEIEGVIQVENLTSLFRAFYHAYSLETVYLYKLKANVDLSDCARLSKDSLLYMINNSQTTAFTITLHASVYAKTQTGGEWKTDVDAALSAHTNVSLASV